MLVVKSIEKKIDHYKIVVIAEDESDLLKFNQIILEEKMETDVIMEKLDRTTTQIINPSTLEGITIERKDNDSI